MLWESLSSHIYLHVQCGTDVNVNLSARGGDHTHPAAVFFSNRSSHLGVKRRHTGDLQRTTIIDGAVVAELADVLQSFEEGMVADPGGSTVMSCDECLSRVETITTCHLGVQCDKALLKKILAPLMLEFGPSRFLAQAVCRCDVMAELFGNALTNHLRKAMHAEFWDKQLPHIANLQELMLQELVQTRSQMTRVRHECLTAFEERGRLTTEQIGDSLILRKSHTSPGLTKLKRSFAACLQTQIILTMPWKYPKYE